MLDRKVLLNHTSARSVSGRSLVQLLTIEPQHLKVVHLQLTSRNKITIMSTFYTCSEYPTADILLASGTDVVEVPISYSYELDYVDEEEGLTKAIQHVDLTLLNRMATVSNLKDCSDVQNSPFRHLLDDNEEGNTGLGGGGVRKLRFKGRGYNSIIGISSNSMDTVKPNTTCQHSSNVGGGTTVQESTQEVEEFNNGVSLDLAGSSVTGEVTEAESGGGGEETERLEEDGTVILEEIKVDGVVDATSVVRSALPAAATKEEEEEEEDLPEGAYNYWSTEQDILEFESTQTQPSVGKILPGAAMSVSNVNMSSPPKTRTGDTPEDGVSCNVIQGELTLFVSKNADPYENLDGRVRDAIAVAFTDPVILEQRFLNNKFIRDIHLLEPTVTTVDEAAASPISIAGTSAAAVSSTSPSSGSTNAGFASSNYAIGVIAGLGAVFLALVGLFAYTSRPSKRRRLDDLSSCHDDTYSNELDAVSALFNGGKQQQSAKKWFEQEGALRSNDSTLSSRRDRNIETPVPTIEASFSDGGVSLKENLFAAEARKSDEEDDSVDMDAHLQLNSVEDSKSRKAKKFGFLRKKRSLDSDDVIIDDDIVVEKVEEHSQVRIDDVFEDGFAIETTRRTAPLRPMAAYTSPTANTTRAHYCDRSIQKCDQSGILSCLPAPEITDEETISVLTDNNYYQSRGPCVLPQGDGRPLTRAVTECVAPTDDRSVKSNQLARRQPQDNTMGAALTECWSPRNEGGDAFAESWNPFEGNFWQGWFE